MLCIVLKLLLINKCQVMGNTSKVYRLICCKLGLVKRLITGKYDMSLLYGYILICIREESI